MTKKTKPSPDTKRIADVIRTFEPAYPYLSDKYDDKEVLACSECFQDVGLRLEARNLTDRTGKCPACGSEAGVLITQQTAMHLAYRFFSLGTLYEPDYGRAPLLVFNEFNETTQNIKKAQITDLEKFERMLGMGFFEYGPPLWMLGEVSPLKKLTKKRARGTVIAKILEKYPSVEISPEQAFFRIRLNPSGDAKQHSQYDSPPKDLSFENGRWDSKELPVLYCSPDIQTCLHECRAHVSDEIYIASIVARSTLKLLDLTHHLEESRDAFSSLDLSLQYIFQAGRHSYDISREIAKRAESAGYDGLLVPSHFSSLRTGHHKFQTLYGMSIRQIPGMREQQKGKIVPNLLLFGHPIQNQKVQVISVNRIYLEQAHYTLRFGPLIDEKVFRF